MKVKKIIFTITAFAMLLLLSACVGGGAVQTNLSGTPEEILNQLLADLESANVHMPMALPPLEVTHDLSHNAIGLSEADFDRLVTSATYSMAAIGTFAHQIIMIEANDAPSAAEVKKLVTGDGGYDPGKWICVWPDRAAAVDSGAYVLLAASYNEVVEAALDSFEAAAGNVGEVITFWEFSGGELQGGDFGGGMGGLAPLNMR